MGRLGRPVELSHGHARAGNGAHARAYPARRSLGEFLAEGGTRVFRKLFPWFITLFMALVDTSVVPFLTNSPFTPLFSLTTIVALGLLLGRRRGALLGLMAGLAVDILVNEPYGLMTIIFTGAGFVSGFAGRKFMNHMWTTVLTPVAVFALMEGILFLYQAFARAAEIRLLAYGAARVGIQTAMVQVLYLLYNAILRPRLSRYGAR